MHALAFLFFSGLMTASALLIRNMFSDADAKIESALAGEYRLPTSRNTVVYLARRRPMAPARQRLTAPARLAA